MKNLKKVLALVLAFACAFTMFAGAAFTDSADINPDNADAVELLSALGVIAGYTDGSYLPEKAVTRAEMAKMIYTIRNGGNDDASAYESVSTSFTDIDGHWAEGYIKYLQNTGIVAGKSATKFVPNSTVTTGEAMKMALVLAGYRADKAGLTGTEWLSNTLSYATTYGLTKDVASSISGDCSRQDAAQILNNVLEMTAVQWSEFVDGFVNDSEHGLAIGGESITVGFKWMDLAIDTGFITRAPSSKTNPKGISFVGEDWGTVTFRDSNLDVSDLFGYEVKVVWNAEKRNDADAIYGIYKTADNSSVETTWADVAKDGTTAKVKFGNTTYTLDLDDNRLPQDSNNAHIVAFADGDVNYLNADAFNEDALADKVIFIDNDADGDFEAVQIKTQDATQVTYVGTSNIDTKDLLATGRIGANQYDPFDDYENTPKLADVNTYEGIAKDDYAKVSYDYYNDKVTYEKIDAVSATIEATRTTGDGTKEIRIDGTWYKPAEGYNMPSVVSGDSIEYIAIGTLLYNVKKTDGTWGSKSLAVVYDVAKYGVGSKANELEVSFITRDGVKKTALLDKYNNVEVVNLADGDYDIDGDNNKDWDSIDDAKNALEGKLLTYRESGNEVSLMPVSKAQAAGYDDIYDATGTDNHVTGFDNANGKLNIQTGGSVSIADTAVVFVWSADGNDADVLTGKAAKSAFKNAAPDGFGQVAAGGEENGVNYIQACTFEVDDVDDVNVVGSNYAYVISAGETNKTDDYREFYLWTVNGEMVAYEKTSDFYEFQGGEIISYDVTSTGDMTVIDNVEVVLGHVGRVTSTGLYGSNNSKVAIGGTEFDLDAACEIINVDTNAKEGIEGDAASAVRYGQAGKFNILYVTNGDDDIVFILVDGVNDEIKTTTTIDVATAGAGIETAVDDAFDSFNYVALDDSANFDAVLTIPTGKRLTVNGNLTLTANLTVNGELVVTGTINDTTQLLGTGSVTVAGIKDTVANTKAAPVITAVEADAESFTAAGGKVTLTFSKVLDATTVAATDFAFGTGSPTVSDVEVDGKTVIITTGAAPINNAKSLTVSGIDDYAGVEIGNTDAKIVFGAAYDDQHTITDKV